MPNIFRCGITGNNLFEIGVILVKLVVLGEKWMGSIKRALKKLKDLKSIQPKISLTDDIRKKFILG